MHPFKHLQQKCLLWFPFVSLMGDEAASHSSLPPSMLHDRKKRGETRQEEPRKKDN